MNIMNTINVVLGTISQGNVANKDDGTASGSGGGLGDNVVNDPDIILGTKTPYAAINILVDILNSIFNIASGIGILLLAWGIVMFVMAIKSEDAESKSRAAMLVVAAVVLVCIGSFVRPILAQIGF